MVCQIVRSKNKEGALRIELYLFGGDHECQINFMYGLTQWKINDITVSGMGSVQ